MTEQLEVKNGGDLFVKANEKLIRRVSSIGTLVIILFLTGCGATPNTVDEIIADAEARRFSGAILIANGDTIVFADGFGSASCDGSVSNTEDTVLAIGSITKFFTDAAIGKLDSEGLLNIDAALADYFDEVPPDKAGITIRQLLEHRSGLDTYHETGNLGDFEQMNREEALAEIFSRRLLFEPGQDEEYSNSGYTVLALLIERQSGLTYTEYLRQNLFEPSGMLRTGFWGDEFSNMAETENEVLGCSAPSSWEYSWVQVGNGGMVSTVGDLHRWLRALESGTVLDETAMRRSGISDQIAGTFGIAGGSSQHEFNAAIVYSGAEELSTIVISNRDTRRAESFVGDLYRAASRELQ